MLPAVLPNAQVGAYYEQAITIGVPDSVSGYPLNWIQYSSLTNYLTGNTWTIVNDAGGTTYQQWGPLTWQCGTLKGTPIVAGTDSIVIFVNANVSILGFPYTQNNTRAFALPLIIDATTTLPDYSNIATELFESYPNPFQDKTSIGILTGKTENATLYVYSNHGQLIYSEVKTLVPGENYFTFNGSSLTNGTYLYTVITSEKTFNKKLIKAE
ncbi:MAG: T9SS type A sorting domain-containing protein [Bacteroidota bacterium]